MIDFMELIDENSSLDVVDDDTGVSLAFYDGRDSIPNELNSYEVVPKTVRVNGLCISVNVKKPEL